MAMITSRPRLNAKSRKRQFPRIAIVGAGLGGIAVAAKLKFAGIDSFTVFEQSAGPGGTWYDNTYPGCAVDVPSCSYSYSFKPYDWVRSHATQPELRQYVEDVIDSLDVRSHFRFSTRVDQVIWNNERSLYEVFLHSGETEEFDVVVSAVGILNVPKYPDWPGLTDFEGPIFHSSRWEHQHDLTGMRVALVGTGSSGCQITPEVAKVAEHLYVFQREPGWIMPKGERDFTPEERERMMKNRLLTKAIRWKGFYTTTKRLAAAQVGSKASRHSMEVSIDYVARTVQDPELRKFVIPQYPLGCKRIIQDSKFYDALNLPNVDLIPKSVARVTSDGLVDADGVERKVDVVILCTGFRATEFLVNLPIVGPAKLSLEDHWSGEPKAFLGITVPGFPNLFMLYGPNTNGGPSVIAQHERQAEVVVRAAKYMAKHDYAVIDTDTAWLNKFIRWVDKQNDVRWSAVHGGCHNYALSRSGRDVNHWPRGLITYLLMTRIGPRFAFKFTRSSAPAVSQTDPTTSGRVGR
jgi:cation diffusion facilitator CzcD-associated flavoprotein CzcO